MMLQRGIFRTVRRVAVAFLALLLLAPVGAEEAAIPQTPGLALKVLTYNVWHGRRTEGKRKFPGEDRERYERRFAWQVEQIRSLDPDVILFQEVNPNKRESRKYAEALGYTEIHKVTNCGIHFPPIKIPTNMNEGLTILGKSDLALKRVGKKKLSGPGNCTAKFGFQTKESRFVLFGEVTVGGRRVLLATTHLHNAPFVLPDFENQVAALVSGGTLTADQQEEILVKLRRRRSRQLEEIHTLLGALDELRRERGYELVVFGGDLNSVPDSKVIDVIKRSGLRSATAAGNPDDFHTFDPIGNAENIGIGSKSKQPLPTYELPEMEALLKPRRRISRQIDHLFSSQGLAATGSLMVLDEHRDGLLGSDHYGVLTVFVATGDGS